jgi:uncharacterized protein (DUF433 family)
VVLRGNTSCGGPLFEHLEGGSTIDEFLEWFPGVTAAQVHEVLEFAKASLEQPKAAA